MGAGQSSTSSLGKGEPYSKQAKIDKELADEFLTLMFNNSDFKDILNVTNLAACPSYIFTTSDALESLFQKLKIYPTQGKQGEILFAPISKVAPGLLKDRGTDKEIQEKMQKRNNLCINVAYFYIRIFQIYSALALTVIDADPTRKRQFQSQNPSKKGLQPAMFMRGGGSMPAPMRGGAGSDVFKDTSFEPLINYFSSTRDGRNIFELKKSSLYSTPNKFIIIWNSSIVSDKNDITVTFYYGNNGSSMEKGKLQMISDSYKSIVYIDNSVVVEFEKISGKWVTSEQTVATIHRFLENKYGISNKQNPYDRYRVERQGAQRPQGQWQQLQRPAQRPQQGGPVPLPQGKSAFTGLDEMKKIFSDHESGLNYFPKAYCIARAMTILTPIFDNEKTVKEQPFYSQICRRKFDFEFDSNSDFMPREGKRPNANVYLRSLVALYYDDYALKGSEIVFTQTETGKSELIQASTQLADLYRIPKDKGTFIESSQEFRSFGMCGTANADKNIQIKSDKFRLQLQNEIILPMLSLQQEHSKSVNLLLKSMFDIKKVLLDGQEQRSMTFSSSLINGGRESVNEFGKKARSLLLNYYMKSEAYFIKSVLLFEENKDAWTFSA